MDPKQLEERITKIKDEMRRLLREYNFNQAYGMANALYLLGVWKYPFDSDSEYEELVREE